MDLTIQANSLFIRFLSWIWGVTPQNLNNICKIFWGTVFFLLGLLLHPIRGYKFIPRIVFSYLIVAVTYMFLGYYWLAVEYYLLAIPFVLIGYRIRNDDAIKSNERFLSKIAGKASAASDWICDHILFPPLVRADDVKERVGDRFNDLQTVQGLKGFFSIVRAYLRSVKEKTCLSVKII